MKIEAKKSKPPITHEKIYKIMLIVMYSASGAFLIKNIIELNATGIVAIGLCLVITTILLYSMKKNNVDALKREFTLSICLIGLIFAISLFSGESYSDDFPLFLAAIGLTGMYMEPQFTKIQIFASTGALVLMYLIHPEKAGSISQYIMCLAIFILAGWLFFMAITRGRAFIDMTFEKEAETRAVLESMKKMGEDIQEDFEISSKQIASKTSELEVGSASIIKETENVETGCGDVHQKINDTEAHIALLNSEVKTFETALSENGANIEAMKRQLKEVTDIINQTEAVFKEMRQKINGVANIANELSAISLRTTLLSLNASVEASHAGDAGIGFAVVATEMKILSESSDMFAEQVAESVKELLIEVDKTGKQFNGTISAIDKSEEMMNELQNSFTALTKQFDQLYDNIEVQNQNISSVDDIFSKLKSKISYMRSYSEENHESVQEIVKAMDAYRENMGKIISSSRIE